MPHRSPWMTDELEAFRGSFRGFLTAELAPSAAEWRRNRMVDRTAWTAMGRMGALLPSIPEAYGGLGGTFAHDAAVLEDLERIVPETVAGVAVSSAIVAHYIAQYGTEAQKLRWLTDSSGRTLTFAEAESCSRRAASFERPPLA